jgi:hypothetical protein
MTNLAMHLSGHTLAAIRGRRLTREGLRYIAMNIFISRVLDFVEDGVIKGRIDRSYPQTLPRESADLLVDCLEAAVDTFIAMSAGAFASEESRRQLISNARGYTGGNGELSTREIVETCIEESLAEYVKTGLYCAIDEGANASANSPKPELGSMQANYLQRFGIALFNALALEVSNARLPDGSLPVDGIAMTLACTDTGIGMLGELNEHGFWDKKSWQAVDKRMRLQLSTERLESGGHIARRAMVFVTLAAR